MWDTVSEVFGKPGHQPNYYPLIVTCVSLTSGHYPFQTQKITNRGCPEFLPEEGLTFITPPGQAAWNGIAQYAVHF